MLALTLEPTLRRMQQHPELVLRTDALLCSINERLGALLPPGEQAGATLLPLSWEWMRDLLALDALEAERNDPDAGDNDEDYT